MLIFKYKYFKLPHNVTELGDRKRFTRSALEVILAGSRMPLEWVSFSLEFKDMFLKLQTKFSGEYLKALNFLDIIL